MFLYPLFHQLSWGWESVLGREDRRHRVRTRSTGLRILRPFRGEIVNVSGLGLGVETSRGLKVRQEYKIVIRHGLRIKRLNGQVKWCSMGRSAGSQSASESLVFKVGIALEDLRPKDWSFLSSSLQVSRPRAS